MPPFPQRMHNRTSGLTHKTPAAVIAQDILDGASIPPAINKIHKQLEGFIFSIDDVIQDPKNARVHEEENSKAIQDSLSLYGQTKPIVVRRQNNVIMAGNGTHQAAKLLGWTKIAAVFLDMTDIEAAGYGIADNRTAELAKWDFRVVAQLQSLMQDAKHPSVGWTMDQMTVLRQYLQTWEAPTPTKNGEGFQGNGTKKEEFILLQFLPKHTELLGKVEQSVRSRVQSVSKGDLVECLAYALTEYLALLEAE